MRLNESMTVSLIPLDFMSPADVIPVIKPLASPEGYISSFGQSDSLLILDTAINIVKIANIIKMLDTDVPAYQPELLYLKHVDTNTVVGILKQHGFEIGDINSAAGKGTRGSTGRKRAKIIPYERLNAIFLIGPERSKNDIRNLITVIDATPPEISSKINVYYLENADATEMAAVLNSIGGGATPQRGVPAKSRITSGNDIVITPDKQTNALIIKADPADYINIVNVIKKLDRRPKQVYVEAMIVEVSVNKALELGTRWRGAARDNNEPVAIGGIGSIGPGSIAEILTGMAGMSIGGMGNYFNVDILQPDGTLSTMTVPGFAALFSMADFKDVINVLSTPQILTSDNKSAEIVVGENVPFLSSFERSTSTTGEPVLQSIERRDVGITLRIKPQISEGDYVKLDIYQEISAIAPTTQAGSAEAADIITTIRSAETSVVVKDMQTVVIGGLIQDQKTRNTTKMPLLGDIPILGHLFKYTSNKKQKTNLLVYITPRILKEFDGLDKLTEERRKDFERRNPEFEQLMAVDSKDKKTLRKEARAKKKAEKKAEKERKKA
ncbi:MAG: type II secretion system secretin GspD, partial [Deltaproteobacteria bacterium]|nr:type II secretion system secretin GspD [Deltaproteobacteria bacterium]